MPKSANNNSVRNLVIAILLLADYSDNWDENNWVYLCMIYENSSGPIPTYLDVEKQHDLNLNET